MPPRWKLYYGDGTAFSADDGAWNAAPQRNLQAVAVLNPVFGRFIYFGWDWYYPLPGSDPVELGYTNKVEDLVNQFGDLGTWNTKDEFGTWLRSKPWLKWGAWMPKAGFDAIVESASEDPTFPMSSPRRRSTDVNP